MPSATGLPLLLTAAAVLYLGWINRDEGHLVAEHGAGYVLGIAGGVILVLTPLYSLRKRARLLRRAGKVRHWFRAHMLAGVVGPVLILFHCNFAPGSTNSAIALFAMLTVAASGVVGRWLYVRVHRGLYGRRMELEELGLDWQRQAPQHEPVLAGCPRLCRWMHELEGRVADRPRGLIRGAGRWAAISLRTRWTLVAAAPALLRARFTRATRDRSRACGRPASLFGALAAVRNHLQAVRRVALFSVYERLFALWHVFHVPLFFLLVISAVVHVVAVHMY